MSSRGGPASLPYRPPGTGGGTAGYLSNFSQLHDDIQPSGRQPLAIAPGSPVSPTAGMNVAPPPIAGPGPVVCDNSSGDDDEQGIVKVKFGADLTTDQGFNGVVFFP